MAQPVKREPVPEDLPRTRAFGTAAVSARQQFSWIWSRESLLRLALSTVLALALWLYVTTKLDPTIAQDLPQQISVSTADVPTNLIVTNNLRTVHIRYRLDNANVPVSASSFRAFIDLTGLKPGRASVPVQVVPDAGITVLRTTPSRIPVILEVVRQKHVPVRFHILKQPPYGYTSPFVHVQPSTVTVSGAASVVAQVTQASVYIDLSQSRSSTSGNYKLSPENSQGETVTGKLTLDPSQVRVDVPINPLSSYKSLPVLVSLKGQPQPGVGVAGITVNPPEITASGSPSALARLSKVTTAPISLTHRGAGTVSTSVPFSLPKGVSSHAGRVQVQVQLSTVSSSSSIEIGVSPVHLAPGLVVRTSPAKVLVTVVGSSSALQTAARNMQAVVDLAGYGPGTYFLAPSIVVAPGLEQEGKVYPETVRVDITGS